MWTSGEREDSAGCVSALSAQAHLSTNALVPSHTLGGDGHCPAVSLRVHQVPTPLACGTVALRRWAAV